MASQALFSFNFSEHVRGEGSWHDVATKICKQVAVDPNMTVRDLVALHLEDVAARVRQTEPVGMDNQHDQYVERGHGVQAVVQEALARHVLHDANPVVDLFSMDAFVARLSSLKEAFPPAWLHALAIKANPLSGILAAAKPLGMGLETASVAEARHALNLGYAPRTVIVDSPCKTTEDLKFFLQQGCYLNLDNVDEIHKVHALLAGAVPDALIGLRINPVVGGGAIAASSTATVSSKFGIPWTADTDADLIALYRDHAWLQGVHVHVGSQGCPLTLLVAGAHRAVAFAKQINQTLGRRQVKVVDIGGGVPTAYNGLAKEAVEFSEYATLLLASVPELFSGEFRVVTEFGRSVFAKAGITLSLVETVKHMNGQNIAVVHCGANQFLRPVYLPKTWPHVFSVFNAHGALKSGNMVAQDIAGPLCFSGDVLARGVLLPQIEAGDYVVMHDTGAYNMAMYSKFNSIPAPAVYAYRSDGNCAIQFSLVRGRETVAETLAFWGPPRPLEWPGFLNQQNSQLKMWRVPRRALVTAVANAKTGSIHAGQRRSISLGALRSSFSTFPHTVIDDQLDIKALTNVNAIVAAFEPSPLPSDNAFHRWVDEHVPATSSDKPLTKEEFDAVVAEAITTLATLEATAWDSDAISDQYVDVSDAKYQQRIAYALVKYKCKDAARYFTLLDKDRQGVISAGKLRDLLLVYAQAAPDEWLSHNFDVLDSDGDGLVSEAEMQQLLLNILGVQKSVLKDLLEQHTKHWTAKHSKQFSKLVLEFETTLKVSEKIRCTWHFAGVPPIPEEDKFKDPPPVPPRYTMSLDELRTSLADEFPEFQTMLPKYTQAIVDGRREFYESRNSKRTNYLRGVSFLTFCGVVDYILTLYA
ncbi:hypothetical protein, variant [Aphanomyces invadans]|uniref:EF-hand domain-containing protein n=1 Tax=Aphanomyces invadans TaxID=157072 RepID=A0A024UQ49_9STRA|nr:hypothetical protein, variant [Aphanomyces invadans]ETW07778.1 hypothetical protein, variant [Aphanomyces invadans]|eukprot:XP_008863871.1 hypothetical protein, variant [Aphanomyces invadans]